MSRTSGRWLVVALGVLAACRGGDGDGKGAKAAAAHDAGPEVIKGRFANARRVGERGMTIIDDTPPPITDVEKARRSFSIDGKPVAVVAYGELPPWLPDHPVVLGDGRTAVRFVLGDYLTALGVDLARVQAIHFYGGRGRVAIMPGDELRRVKKQLLFSFTEGDAGKMRMHWDGKLEVSDTIDKVQAIAIYIDKKAPRWDRAKWGLVDDNGVEYEGVPYVETPLRGGVRIYLDSRLAHLLKRNRTFDRGTEPHRFVDGVPHFRLFDYLEEEKVDAAQVVALELLSKNEVVHRIEGAALDAEREAIEMSAPPSKGGRVLVHVGSGASARSLEVTAINLFTAARARARHRR